jgi:hypothetical protein
MFLGRGVLMISVFGVCIIHPKSPNSSFSPVHLSKPLGSLDNLIDSDDSSLDSVSYRGA